jgi:AhpD family alkylhydroperoxidase
MKIFSKLALVATTLLTLGTVHAEPDAKATYADMQKTLGLVPTFMKAFPEAGIAAAWDELKSLELNPHTALSPKTKELIGLAVAAQIPCKYCTYFHTQVAKLDGASDEDLKEAIAMAALTRHWSTVLNGLQIDLGEFKQELGRAFDYVKKGHATTDIAVVDQQSAYKDITQTLGGVPTFMRRFPDEGISAAWREFKMIELNPHTSLDGKTKELVGLGVAAQIPCAYCIAFHTEAAKLNGATDMEIREAVAMAALTRHWSTVLNGSMVDEAQFRKEIDQVVKGAKK